MIAVLAALPLGQRSAMAADRFACPDALRERFADLSRYPAANDDQEAQRIKVTRKVPFLPFWKKLKVDRTLHELLEAGTDLAEIRNRMLFKRSFTEDDLIEAIFQLNRRFRGGPAPGADRLLDLILSRIEGPLSSRSLARAARMARPLRRWHDDLPSLLSWFRAPGSAPGSLRLLAPVPGGYALFEIGPRLALALADVLALPLFDENQRVPDRRIQEIYERLLPLEREGAKLSPGEIEYLLSLQSAADTQQATLNAVLGNLASRLGRPLTSEDLPHRVPGWRKGEKLVWASPFALPASVEWRNEIGANGHVAQFGSSTWLAQDAYDALIDLRAKTKNDAVFLSQLTTRMREREAASLTFDEVYYTCLFARAGRSPNALDDALLLTMVRKLKHAPTPRAQAALKGMITPAGLPALERLLSDTVHPKDDGSDIYWYR